MSQASRYKALAPVRIREQVARELAKDATDGRRARRGAALALAASRLLDGGHIDVHSAREHARSLVALEAEQIAFEDWTRAQGLGPENRDPGAFTGHLDAEPVPKCCFGDGYWQDDDGEQVTGRGPCLPCEETGKVRGGWPGDLAKAWAKQGGDSRAPMGRSLARLGRHILAALEGQPSECQSCAGEGWATSWERGAGGFSTPEDEPCPDCQGTGHNLRGELGPVIASAQIRRRRVDQGVDADGIRTGTDTWLDDEASTGIMGPGWGYFATGVFQPTTETRVTARGEHRGRPMPFSDITTTADRSWAWHGVRPMWTRGLPAWDAHMARLHDLLPRWRRGEIKHEEQRRAEEARAFADDVRRAVAVIR